MRFALLPLEMLVCSVGSEAAAPLPPSSSTFGTNSRNCFVIPSSGWSASNTVQMKESRVSLLSESARERGGREGKRGWVANRIMEGKSQQHSQTF